MKTINYILNGFGYDGSLDFRRSLYGLCIQGEHVELRFILFSIAGAFRLFLGEYVGFDLPVFWAFVFLIAAEFWTGIKVAKKVKGQKFQSRKFGRMILKIGTYLLIVGLLNIFAKSIDAPDVMGVSMNPLIWLYYTVFIAIIFQLFISWLENLGQLGYKETKTLAGFVLRIFNKWFEFDGSKNNDE